MCFHENVVVNFLSQVIFILIIKITWDKKLTTTKIPFGFRDTKMKMQNVTIIMTTCQRLEV